MKLRHGVLGTFISALVCLLIPLSLFYLLFIEGMWEGTEFDWIGLGSSILMLGIAIWLLRDVFSEAPSAQQPSTTTPLIDEWIGERGFEASERAQWQHHLDKDEALLALIAAWSDQPINRFAVTSYRVVLYSQSQIQHGTSLQYEHIASIEQTPHRFRRHLADITLTLTKGQLVTFADAGTEYAKEVVTLVTRQRTLPHVTAQTSPRPQYCTQCGTRFNSGDHFCGACGVQR
jgi:hypothetical protein